MILSESLLGSEETIMPIVIMTIFITFLVLISWTYRSLESMEINRKVLWIVAELFVVWIATFITYHISKNTIEYPNDTVMGYVQNILVFLFTGINGLFVMPFFSRGVEALYQESASKEQIVHRTLISLAILVVLLVLECGYMTNTQEGILRVMKGRV